MVSEIFEPDNIVPAPGQGALAVECRAEDTELAALLAAIDHPATRAAVTAERSLLAALEAGCSAPVGAYAVQAGRGQALPAGVGAGRSRPACGRGRTRQWWCANVAKPMPRTRRALGVSWRRGCWRLAPQDLIGAKTDRDDAHD